MGGALTIASSVRIPEVDAVVCFYGIPPPELADPTQAKAPVQAHFGENDPMKGFSDAEVNAHPHGSNYASTVQSWTVF